MITGWLFDIYCLDDKIVLWIKDESRLYKIEKQWTPSLYVASNSPSKLKRLENHPLLNPFVKNCKKTNKIQSVFDTDESSVLQLTLKNSKDILKLAKSIEKLDTFGVYKLYNVDVPPEQTYLYENDLYPLGKYQIKKDDKIKWDELSDIADTNYVLPILRKTILKVYPKTNKPIPNFSDAIEKIQIDDIIIKSKSEQEMILTCVEYIQNLDPDILITYSGDSWDFPYLAERAFRNKILDKLVFGREDNRPILRSKRKVTSYFAYGQVHFKPLQPNFWAEFT
ncbi:3'-5' exonuclease [Nitrosopumilus sp.]|uniref:3'-5' exonuclease n=1 Tax=Nitrosopumilus sp. TaxID=2024843 RepID=UPI003B5BF12E